MLLTMKVSRAITMVPDPSLFDCHRNKKWPFLYPCALSSVSSGPQQHHPHRLWLQEGIHLLGRLDQAEWSKDQQDAPQREWPQGTAGCSCCDFPPHGPLCLFLNHPRNGFALLVCACDIRNSVSGLEMNVTSLRTQWRRQMFHID